MRVKSDLRSSIRIDVGERGEVRFGDDQQTKPNALTELFVLVRTRDEHLHDMNL